MQMPPTIQSTTTGAASPAASLAQHMRWLVLIALAAIAVLVVILSFATYTVPTVLVPDRGGVFREGVAGAPQYLHPVWCQNSNNIDSDLCNLVYRGLMRLGQNGRIVPDLAESWSVVDGRIYQFRLKPNLFWHDGQALTVDDVMFSYSILQDPSLAEIPGLPRLWRSVTVEKLDNRTIQITLPQPFAPFIDLTTVGLLPRHIYGDTPAKDLVTKSLTETPIGAGPMRIVETTPEHVRLEPNPFNTGFSPYISALEFDFYPDYGTMVAAFDAQQIDGLSTLLPSEVNSAAAHDDVQTFSSIEFGYENILLNVNNPNAPFFQNIAVRQALLYALDRKQLIDEVLSGQGIVAEGLISPNHWAYTADVKQYGFDRDLARSLLDQAGWIDSDGDGVRDKDGKPFSFILLVKDDALHQQIGTRLAADWAEIGVRADMQAIPFSGLVADFLAPRAFEAALTDWNQVGDPDPFPQWHSSQIEGNGQNYAGWQSAEADQLMDAARQTIDEDERRALYAQFQAIFAEELPSLPLFHPLYTYGVSTRVHNVEVGALNTPAERFDNFDIWYIDSRRVPTNQVPSK
ncbi:MAG: peptide ABC transporter substrate-binding protein [Caldilineaceae bacterium]|jgi:peptide/nickel transport system substrate-binding protein|nr:peptide ABC transporter substrate-binding protein [Caldilineaceae bacterium]